MKKLLTLLLALMPLLSWADDGSTLWLPRASATHGGATVRIDAPDNASQTLAIASNVLGLHSAFSQVTLAQVAVGCGTGATADHPEGFAIAIERDEAAAGATGWASFRATVSSPTPVGLLYGAFDLLRLQQTTAPHALTKSERPAFRLRMLNHWDNLDGSVERGYAGRSIWKWDDIRNGQLSDELLARLTTYARACASVGLNGTVLNNVNTQPAILTRAYINKVKPIADLLRPYGIRVFLSVNFASPMALGDTKTADPLDAKVQRWWARKTKEIYTAIPDFGGFLVKANSEGQPGPGDYHRTHAEGANMLAAALKPYGGTVIWRSFVYGANHKGEDRVKQAVSEFKPMDGLFADNVLLQSKNGPLDFQPREPYAPIFDQITKTPQMAELQITQEYLGQSKHLVYLAPMWKEFFSFVSPERLVGIAGVANTGDDANWCGHPFSQANWYAFGRLAWNPDLRAEDIADEWLRQTFGLTPSDKSALSDTADKADLSDTADKADLSDDATVLDQLRYVMLTSREACVDYMMPLGLHHIFKFDHHMGPEPDGFKAEYPLEWCPVYYHKADTTGVGFDRTVATGSGATAQYREPLASQYERIETCPEQYLLWFHHVPWTHRMKSGRTLWEELRWKYREGVAAVDRYRIIWQSPAVRSAIDADTWQHVDSLLRFQQQDARLWQRTCVNYFGGFTRREEPTQKPTPCPSPGRNPPPAPPEGRGVAFSSATPTPLQGETHPLPLPKGGGSD